MSPTITSRRFGKSPLCVVQRARVESKYRRLQWSLGTHRDALVFSVRRFPASIGAQLWGLRMSRDEIIAAHPITDFVRGRGHELKRAGANFVTNACPVTQHKRGHRPVMLYSKTQSWSCHDCEVGGSVIDWLMREKNISAADAMRELSGGRNGSSEPVAVYDYTDASGKLIYQVCRFEPKDFRQRRPDGNGGFIWNTEGVERVLYHLPSVIKADAVAICEGEKDCDNVFEHAGIVATCNVGGAGKWRDHYSETLRGKDVIVFGDNDPPGKAHVEQVVRSLHGKARSIKVVTLPDGFHDVSDYMYSLPKWTATKAIDELIETTPVLEVLPEAPAAENDEADPIARLAALPVLEYERIREAEAEKLQCRVSVLDRLVNAQRLLLTPSESDNLQGNAVVLADIEPWPDPVSGAEVLDGIVERVNRYVVLPQGAADVPALFCAHTHCYKLFQCSPRLNISSPEKSCGKTTLRDVLACFVPRPVLTENLTTAVLFRLVDAQSPVILADEYDSWITGNEELRGLLNAGHRKGAMVFRCEGDNNEVRGFAAYTPAVLCGIGALPGTLHDRSIVIRLERAKRGELQARFDSRHVEVENELCRKLARWCIDNRDRIAACEPKLPENAFNRVADNWRPLFAIAEIVGSDWPRRCADAFARLTSRESEDAESLRVMLLADIQQVFTAERMFSKDLIEQLAQLSERPWPEVCRGKAITERWLARNLAAFGIRSKTLRIGEERAKGYELSDFKETFERYLKPEEGDFIRDTVTYEGKRPFSIRDKKRNVTDENSPRTEGMSRCHACGTPKPAKGIQEALI
jgi:uncharacterized protein DUF3631/CHC2-type zinc finger protein